MSGMKSVLSDEDRELLHKVYNMLNELIETLEILEDRELMSEIKEAKNDIEEGRVREYKDFIRELRESEEI